MEKIKLSTIIGSQDSLSKILTTKLPVKIAYKISKLVNLMQADLKIYEEQRVKLIKDLGEQTDKEKDLWSVKKENIPHFAEELAKLQDIEVELGFGEGKPLEKIKIEELGNIECEPNDLVSLNWLLED